MAFDISTLLPTPWGWSSVYDVREGDVLFDEKGLPCRVTKVSDPRLEETVSFEVGWGKQNKPNSSPIYGTLDQSLYSFWEMDYRRLVDINERTKSSHFSVLDRLPSDWISFSRGDIPRDSPRGRKAKRLAKLSTLENLPDTIYTPRMKNSNVRNHSIPISHPLQLPDRPFIIDPWIMGVLVNYHNGEYLRIPRIIIPFYINEFKKRGINFEKPHDTSSYPWKMLKINIPEVDSLLKELDYVPHTIPKQYLRGSHRQRVDLMHGLMDQYQLTTHDQKRRQVCYYTLNSTLSDQVVELIRTLGYPAYVKRINVNGHYIMWHPIDSPWTYPRLKYRHAILTEKIGNPLNRYIWQIYNAEKTEKRFVKSIEVDSQHNMYLITQNFIPMKDDHG